MVAFILVQWFYGDALSEIKDDLQRSLTKEKINQAAPELYSTFLQILCEYHPWAFRTQTATTQPTFLSSLPDISLPFSLKLSSELSRTLPLLLQRNELLIYSNPS